jgi:hypothetical protein
VIETESPSHPSPPEIHKMWPSPIGAQGSLVLSGFGCILGPCKPSAAAAFMVDLCSIFALDFHLHCFREVGCVSTSAVQLSPTPMWARSVVCLGASNDARLAPMWRASGAYGLTSPHSEIRLWFDQDGRPMPRDRAGRIPARGRRAGSCRSCASDPGPPSTFQCRAETSRRGRDFLARGWLRPSPPDLTRSQSVLHLPRSKTSGEASIARRERGRPGLG